MTTLHLRKSAGFLLIPLAFVCFALSSPVQAAPKPPPDGGYPNGNTAEGTGPLFSLTTGANNTAMGFDALFRNTTGSDNTAYGYQALYNNLTSSTPDTYGQIVGEQNTATGFQALYSNTTGGGNDADGYQALFSNTIGFFNTALGGQALFSNITGFKNTAVGSVPLFSLTSGESNVAVGNATLTNSVNVSFNTAIGRRALMRTQGDQNIGLGFFAGSNLNDGGTNNIFIGNVGPVPIGSESNTIRIGTQTATTVTLGGNPPESHPIPAHTTTFIAGIYGATTSDAASTTPVVIDMNGNLATAASSERFKKDIGPMDKASEAILALKPVKFHYKKDTKGIPQFGLIAEDVAKINPALVTRDAKGEIYTVRYEAVNAMLLNEFLKEHRKVEQQEASIAKQQKQIEALTTGLQKVSDQLELSKPAPRTVSNNQ